ncbi:hypothetical protein GCM10027521_18520 [Amycolatopsis cihanbeyliensis]
MVHEVEHGQRQAPDAPPVRLAYQDVRLVYRVPFGAQPLPHLPGRVGLGEYVHRRGPLELGPADADRADRRGRGLG